MQCCPAVAAGWTVSACTAESELEPAAVLQVEADTAAAPSPDGVRVEEDEAYDSSDEAGKRSGELQWLYCYNHHRVRCCGVGCRLCWLYAVCVRLDGSGDNRRGRCWRRAE